MWDPLPNPYFNLATIRNPEMFFGRTLLLRRFYETVFNRQSVSLLGPRHIGKSSFLWCVALPEMQARFPYDLSRHIFVFLDLREYLQKTCEDFFHHVSKELILQSAKVGLSLQAESKGEDEFSSVLDQIAEQGFFPVLLLDGFDKVTRNEHFGPEFFWFLRAQASMGLVSYITASMKSLYEVCHPDIVGSPFFNIFYVYSLDAFALEEARALITIPAKRAALPFLEEEVELVLKLAGRHPFFIQRICHALYEEKLLHGGGEVDEQRLKNLAYKDLHPRFHSIWEELSAVHQLQLQDEAQQKGNQQRELPELSESQLFRHFVRKTCEVELFRMTTEELDEALDKIDNPQALGMTNLRLMRIVVHRLGKDAALSTTKRGMVIREILNEALERLRGSGSRTESAPEWRHYNILHYRYFKHQLKNEHISARLGFTSIRQFYRERNKALELFLNVLFEMEQSIIVSE